jgi:hypothetical protein
MAEGDADDRSGATGGGPGDGTTAPASGGAAQGAGSGPASAPAPGTTDDNVIQIGQPAETQKGGAGDDEVAKLKDKLGYLQPAYDEAAKASKALKAVRELHPELFDADGTVVGTRQTKPEEGVIQIGGAGAERPAAGARQTPPARQYVGPQASPVDPQQAVWKETNLLARERLFTGGEDEQGDVVGAVATVLPGLLHEYGLTPEFLAQRGGGPGISPEQIAQLVDQRAAQFVQQHEQEVKAFADRVEAINAQCGPELLAQKVKFANAPAMTLAQALPRIMQETQTRDPMAAMLSHPDVGPAARKALVQREAMALARQIISEQTGMQIMDSGGGMPGAGNVTDDLESIGASDTPPVR